MIVGAMLVRLHLPASESLKDKRQVVKSLIARLGNQFGVAVAEIGELNTWQIAELGVSCVSNQAGQVDRVLDSVLKYIEETRPDVEILAADRESLRVFD
jgi:uncharacterized protein YlxP (DUF503 family)